MPVPLCPGEREEVQKGNQNMQNLLWTGAVLALAGAAASAQTSAFINFDTDPPGGVPNGFVSDDSPLVSFSDLGAGQLLIGDFGFQSDGPSLVNFAETPVRFSFARPVTNIAMLMGDDDSAFLGGADVFTRIVGFRNGQAVAQRIIRNNGDDIINDGPFIEGIFDAVQVEFTNAAGVRHPALPEVIDRISFAVADEVIDFESDAQGPVPNGFVSSDSNLVRFSDTDGSNLQIINFFTGKSDGLGLFSGGDNPSGVRMRFARPVTAFSCQVGNDDGAFVGGTVYATLRGYLDGVNTANVVFQTNSNNDMDDGPAITGVFDRIDFFYTDASGTPINLSEIIDNIAFATASQYIDFESDTPGLVPNGFESDDSPIVAFTDTIGANLQIVDFFTNKSDGQGLVVFSDDDSALRMDFDAIVSTLTLDFGNDDPTRAPVFATLRGFRNGVMTREVISPTLSDNAINESVSIAGAFDAIEFQYTNADGSPITNGLIEIVDNIRFSVESQFIDFNDDPTGNQPNGFVSNDSSLVSFTDTMGSTVNIADAGEESDGPGLRIFGDDVSRARMDFVTPVNTLTVEFGNDDGSFVGGPIWATIRAFRGNIPEGRVTVQANANDILDQSITFTGLFTRADFYYSDANGNPINLIEVVDNIRFDVATGPLPCNGADLTPPFGVLDLSDINAFVAAFIAQGPAADFDQNGIWDLSDINTFVSLFIAGCP
jgi:hypothetical protein